MKNSPVYPSAILMKNSNFAAQKSILMRKYIFRMLLPVLACLFLTSCHKDCVCKYYRNNKLYDIKTWDDKHLTEKDCDDMNDEFTLSIPLDQVSDIPVGDVELVDMRVVCEQD